MTPPIHHHPRTTTTRPVRLVGVVVAAITGAGLLAACGAAPSASAGAAADAHTDGVQDAESARALDVADQAAAMVATARFQDVAVAEAAGYASSIDSLGCFEDPVAGGMGVHYVNGSLLDDHVDATTPEALVYELDATGAVNGLVAHEYIVPVDAWTSRKPPQLFGQDFHRHPVLPLWVLHTWFWKDNPTGVFATWNPAVRPCPDGVPVFGEDLP